MAHCYGSSLYPPPPPSPHHLPHTTHTLQPTPQADAMIDGHRARNDNNLALESVRRRWRDLGGFFVSPSDESELSPAVTLARCCLDPPSVSTLAWSSSVVGGGAFDAVSSGAGKSKKGVPGINKYWEGCSVGGGDFGGGARGSNGALGFVGASLSSELSGWGVSNAGGISGVVSEEGRNAASAVRSVGVGVSKRPGSSLSVEMGSKNRRLL